MKSRCYFIFLVIFLFTFAFENIRSQIFWDERVSGVTVSLNSVSDINAAIAWFCGDSGTVIKTTNGGYAWQNVSLNGIPANVKLVNIFGVSASVALTAGIRDSVTFVYRTTNSGANWTQVFTQINGSINAIWMKTDTVGFMQGNPVGGRWSLWKTTNRGANWDSIGLFLPRTGNETGYKNSLWIVGNKIWFGTNNSKIYYSDSSGYRWFARSTAPEVNSYAVWWENAPSLIGYCAGSTLLRTTNGGNNWTVLTTPGTGNFSGFVGNASFNYYYYLRGNGIYNSFGGITNWTINYTAPSGIYNHITKCRTCGYGAGHMYAVRNNGGITRGNAFIEGVKIISNEIPSEYKLYQNYPNPFNASTKIKIDSRVLPSSLKGEIRGGFIKLIIYDIQGREVYKILNHVIQPGVYEGNWDGSNSPTGIYFCRMLITDPNGFEIVYDKIIKMALIK